MPFEENFAPKPTSKNRIADAIHPLRIGQIQNSFKS